MDKPPIDNPNGRHGRARGPYRTKGSDGGARQTERRCLACGRMFKSDLPVRLNRICPTCTSADGRDNGMFGAGTLVVEQGGWTSRDSDD